MAPITFHNVQKINTQHIFKELFGERFMSEAFSVCVYYNYTLIYTSEQADVNADLCQNGVVRRANTPPRKPVIFLVGIFFPLKTIRLCSQDILYKMSMLYNIIIYCNTTYVQYYMLYRCLKIIIKIKKFLIF